MNFSDSELIWVFNRNRGRCLYCGGEISFHAHREFGLPSPEQSLTGKPGFVQAGHPRAWVVDRFIPTAHGGTDQIFNWVAACPSCAYRKGERLPWEFDPDRFEQGVMDPDNSALMSLMKDRGAGGGTGEEDVEKPAVISQEKQDVEPKGGHNGPNPLSPSLEGRGASGVG